MIVSVRFDLVTVGTFPVARPTLFKTVIGASLWSKLPSILKSNCSAKLPGGKIMPVEKTNVKLTATAFENFIRTN
jgi:hypothetical protein